MHGDFNFRGYVLRPLAVAFLVAACVFGVLALASPHVGLGIHQQFVFYLWFGLTRANACFLAIPAVLFGLVATGFAYARRPGLFVANAALVVGAVVFSLLLTEVLARLIDHQPVFALRNWVAERRTFLTTKSPNDYDPVLGWVFKSDQSIDADDPAKSLTTGQYGVRLNQPGHKDLPAGAILAVGDSFTAGDEVGDRDAWPAILEDILGRRVINGATYGWGADQIALRTEQLVPILAPSTVIVSFFQDFQGDIDRAGLRVFLSANKPYFTLDNGALVSHNIPVPRYRGRLGETSRWLIAPSYSYLVQFMMDRMGWSTWWQVFSANYVSVDNDPIAVSCALLKRLQSEMAGKGIDFLFVMQYGGALKPVKRPLEASSVVACARALGIDTLDLWDDLKAEHDRRSFEDYLKLWASFDGNYSFGHMSGLGNRFVAERIAAALEKKHPRAATAGGATVH
jgi:hypothetical protein